MLVEFRVKNFRSIKEEQCLSMVASNDKLNLTTHTMDGGIGKSLRLVKTAVMYGANASGKSNIIKAMKFMQYIVTGSATQMREGLEFNFQHFKLDNGSANQPSEFEITFIDQGIRYQYGFRLNKKRIVNEWLIVYKSAKPQTWFKRSISQKTHKDTYTFGSNFTGQKKLWQDSTRSNALFLSKAVDLNSELLKPIFLWLVQKLVIFEEDSELDFEFSTKTALKNEGKSAILAFLKSADLNIIDIKLKSGWRKKFELKVEDNQPGVAVSEPIHIKIPTFTHETENGDVVDFEYQEESSGTQKIFDMAGPLLDILFQGRILIIDEFEASLHPAILKFIIKLFYSNINNPKSAQLIFSTHNTELLNQKLELFRRDQIWLVEKDLQQSTRLYPLTDFSPRNSVDLQKGYLMGRYGAIPFLTEFGY